MSPRARAAQVARDSLSVGTEMCACRGNPSVSGKPGGRSPARGQFFSLWPAPRSQHRPQIPTSPGTCPWCPSPGGRHHPPPWASEKSLPPILFLIFLFSMPFSFLLSLPQDLFREAAHLYINPKYIHTSRSSPQLPRRWRIGGELPAR